MKAYILYFDANNCSRVGPAGTSVLSTARHGFSTRWLNSQVRSHASLWPEFTQAFLLHNYPQALCECSGEDFYNMAKKLATRQLM